jgi:hypothetical protein
MAIASEIPETLTGVRLLPVVLPKPSSPDEALIPQHFISPSSKRAHVCKSPAEMAIASDIPETLTGVRLLVVLEFPSCPKLLSPQHRTLPSPTIAQVWDPVEEVDTAMNLSALSQPSGSEFPGRLTVSSQEYHWKLTLGSGSPNHVPTLAVKVDRFVAEPEIVGSTEFAGTDV